MKTTKKINDANNLINAGKYNKAKDICKKITNSDPTNSDAFNILAEIALNSGNAKNAIAYFKKSLGINPTQPIVSLKLSIELRKSGYPKDAIKILLGPLMDQQPYHAYRELGLSHIDLNDFQKAEKYLSHALKLKPSCWHTSQQLIQLLIKRNSLDEAAELVREIIKIEKRNPHAYAELTKIHLMKSDPKTALEVNAENLRVEPAYTRGFALKYIALSELEDLQGSSYLYDYDNLVQRFNAKCPTRFSSIKNFNITLAKHIVNNIQLQENSNNYTTVNGAHTGFNGIFKNNKQLGICVHEMVSNAINRYISILSLDSDHPINTSRPLEYNILIWAVVTGRGGYEKPHIHPKSWIGGSYYVDLPDDFDLQTTKNAGWIEFGRGEEGLHKLHSPKTRTYKPVEGDFLIFPGYFWHNTIPLESKQKRIVLAFDVQPINGWGN